MLSTNRFIMIFISSVLITSTGSAPEDGLIAIYNSFYGHGSWNATNWLIGDPCTNNWIGVTCNLGDIVVLDLQGEELVGSLPSEAES